MSEERREISTYSCDLCTNFELRDEDIKKISIYDNIGTRETKHLCENCYDQLFKYFKKELKAWE